MSCLDNSKKETELVTVKDLFSNSQSNGQNVFRIPDYQRGYAWEADKEFKALWEDILKVYLNGNTTQRHYTGMLSLEEMNDASKEREGLCDNNAFFVVDGQQRLTSIVIIVKALIQYIKDLNGKNLEGDLLSFNHVYRFNYSVDRRDDDARTFFENRIYLDEKSDSFADMYLKNINEAKNYIDTYLNRYDVVEAENILDVVLNRLVFNIYFVVPNFDVRVTFETMNNRGKKLSTLELLKNRLMYLSTFVGNGNLNNETNLKNKINVAWKNIYKNICYSAYQLDDDEYLQAHWIVYESLDKTNGKTYVDDILNKKFSIDGGEFYNYIRNKEYDKAYEHIFEYVSSLEKYSKFWGIINNPLERASLINNKEEIKYLDRLNRIASIRFVRSAVMVIAGERELTSDQRIKAYTNLERTVFINKLIGRTKNDFSAITTKARDLLQAKETLKINDSYHELIKAMNSSELSTDTAHLRRNIEKFASFMKDKEFSFYSWDGITYFLYQYNEFLERKDKELSVVWNSNIKNSIEHILPQNPSRTYWEIVLSPLNNDEEKIKRVTNSLGNLLLLSNVENSTEQNHSYPVKREKQISSRKYAYLLDSRSAQQVAQEHKNWLLTDIQSREKQLFEFMYDEWLSFDPQYTKKEFLDSISNYGLLLSKQPKLNKNLLQQLSTLNFDDEINLKTEQQPKHDRDWFEALKNYFDTSRYSLGLNSKNLAYVNNKFTFTKKGTKLECAIREDDTSYKFSYSFDTEVLKILKYEEDGEHYLFDQTQMDECVLHFVGSFNRYLLRYEGRKDAFIFEGEEPADKSSSQRYTEDEFVSKRAKFSQMVILYKKLKDELDLEFNDDSEYNVYFTQHYAAFNSKKNFAELHINKDKLLINTKDPGYDNSLGRAYSSDRSSSFKYQITLSNEEQLKEAIQIIKSAHDLNL